MIPCPAVSAREGLAIPGVEAAGHSPHPLHSDQRIWVEKNCYIDVWIEVLHSLGLEPTAIMPFASGIDFQGGQWTFFKPPHDELIDLYGIEVQELNVWLPLIEHAQELLASGHLVSTEADAFWLPDTSGTDYRRNHVKTTIVLSELDLVRKRLGYFHNAGYFVLEEEDFSGTFELDGRVRRELPLFAEVICTDQLKSRPVAELVSGSQRLWQRHLARSRAPDPMQRFQSRFERELPAMQEKGMSHYHQWAFGTTRQLGAASELCCENLRWMQQHGVKGLDAAIASYMTVAINCKTFILKAARCVNSRRSQDFTQVFADLARHWDRAREEAWGRLSGEPESWKHARSGDGSSLAGCSTRAMAK